MQNHELLLLCVAFVFSLIRGAAGAPGVFRGQTPLATDGESAQLPTAATGRKLHGKFLHITDFHPDPFYKSGSSLSAACHHSHGSAGYYGSPTSDCDSPLTLVNATVDWINSNLADELDFIVWTGDSARHDNDHRIPRTEKQLQTQNTLLIDKVQELVRAQHSRPAGIPLVPNIGNNDVMPHNIFKQGPNRWTKFYGALWEPFIPEHQRHTFARLGSFTVEVVPGKLAVVSLNTMYLFASNAAIDGCAKKSEPGYETFDWLRVQLQFMRDRGVKALIMGHVPPARTDGKQSWDETCWQKYALWMREYRDVIVGALYGHMNVDHFMLQDFHEIELKPKDAPDARKGDAEFTVASSADYLMDLREEWSALPSPPDPMDTPPTAAKKKKKQFHKKIGGHWHERYSVSLVPPSIIPTFYPGLRVFEYNTTGLDAAAVSVLTSPLAPDTTTTVADALARLLAPLTKKKHRKFPAPRPPPKSAPPGPAYSPQPLTLAAYTQYYANLTRSNAAARAGEPAVDYAVEYDTATDAAFALPDLTVRNFVHLASRIGGAGSAGGAGVGEEGAGDGAARGEDEGCDACEEEQEADVDAAKKKKKKKHKHKKKKKHHKQKHSKASNRLWYRFVSRAFVSTKSDDEIRDEFGP